MLIQTIVILTPAFLMVAFAVKVRIENTRLQAKMKGIN